MTTIVIVGGTSGIGLELARRRVKAGDDVVITGRDDSRCAAVAAEIGARCRGVAVELSDPGGIGAALSGVERVDHLVVAAIDRDQNTAADYSVERAMRLVTLKLVGYTEVVHALLPRMTPDGAVVLFGGLAKDRPYPGSTTVSTINGGIAGLVHTLAVELAPLRVNAVHPGIVGDSPFWSGKPLDAIIARTPIGRLATMADVADAVDFLLRNPAMNGVNLNVDGGWLLA
ncbi:SDR family NAD(P)-dependent oxidoreductase [Jiangella sp. DSM 45060]|uniref:SDR family NAD(P)-dependent oxidoreductase n=1 Tax=Jiangella sp. DSM 45060 TaxID=1798224 RepID=UPI00087C71D7|nr:SDR family oxidoreductase [Jiangella sp. DSM 45060]SDS39634.1 NAD(P)-dependent dehydrogenase, short-chain alcohol dehydrogenase family [Jiangella sp. DSM 45060]